MFELPGFVEEIIKTIEKAGFEAYLVGGCVRDMLLGMAPHDYDIASDALPSDICTLFKKTVLTGAEFGTVTVIIGENKVEVTTFRCEGCYHDSRRPGKIDFVNNIEEDLSRRDFTVNAMAYNKKRGLIDPFCGRADIEKKVVKTVGEPEKRFSEDALRILRALRFKAKLSFEIEKNTMNSIKALAPNVSKISGERIKSELDKILLSKSPDVINEVANLKILDFLMNPEQVLQKDNEFKIIAGFELSAMWSQFFYYRYDMDINKTLNYLHFSKELRQDTIFYLNSLKEPIPKTKTELKYKLSCSKNKEKYKNSLELRKKLFKVDISQAMRFYNEIFIKKEPYNIKMLDINGNDLSEIGILKGTECGEILRQLLDLVINNPSLNDKKTLLRTAEAINYHH